MDGIKIHGLVIREDLIIKNFKDKHWYYQIKDLGFKYNMNDLMAAIGQVQLKKLNGFNKKRNFILKKYLVGIENCKNIKPYFAKFNEKNCLLDVCGKIEKKR